MSGAGRPARGAPAFVPAFVGEVEVGGHPGDLAVGCGEHGRYRRARLLARLHGAPLGFLELAVPEDGLLRGPALVAAAQERLGEAIAAHLRRDRLDPGDGLATAPDDPACRRPGPHGDALAPVSVVVCTRDRGDSLRRTLLRLLELEHPVFEVVVVDNAPRTDAARTVVEELADERLRYVLEPVSGLSRARNRGLQTALHPFVAFTDDDVLVDRDWLAALMRGFTRSGHVGCVTGIVPGAECETPAQAYFESRVRWSEAMEPALYDLAANRPPGDPFFPYSAGRFGTGANFAVARAAVQEVGDFDEALGPGVPAQNADDLDFFLRTILGGWTLAYEPAAIAWHVHRREMEALRAQMRTYGTGLAAYTFKHLRSPRRGFDIARRVPAALAILLARARRAEGVDARARGLARIELAGMFSGPGGYLRGRREVRARLRREGG